MLTGVMDQQTVVLLVDNQGVGWGSNDVPSSTGDAETNAESDTDHGPQVWARLGEEVADIEALALACDDV